MKTIDIIYITYEYDYVCGVIHLTYGTYYFKVIKNNIFLKYNILYYVPNQNIYIFLF